MNPPPNLPREPGYYWRHGINQDLEMVDQVVLVDVMVRNLPNELFYWEAGEMGGIFIKDEPDTWWSDKIERTGESKPVLYMCVLNGRGYGLTQDGRVLADIIEKPDKIKERLLLKYIEHQDTYSLRWVSDPKTDLDFLKAVVAYQARSGKQEGNNERR